MINIQQIFNRYNIKYRTEGKNVKRGNTNVCCPFCGDDEGFHLGIEPSSKKWGCWKNLTHKGRGYRKLFQKLLKLPIQQIIELCEEKYYNTDDDFKQLRAKLFNTETDIKEKHLELPLECIDIKLNHNDRFYKYLISRNFDALQIYDILNHYKLKACLLGKYSFRIIIPIYKDNKLVTFTSRTIRENEPLRYKTLSREESVININKILFDYDSIINGGNILFIVEGPFDAMKMVTLINPNDKVTCLFTKNITDQIFLLTNISELYDKLVIILDKGEQTFTLKRQLEHITNLCILEFPFTDIKDPGEFTRSHINVIMEKLSG